jgi:TetR/AcrR family transcriptional repressor of nem operon
MARPREFDESTVLDSAVLCFWSRGYEATSIRDLEEKTGLTTASLYNAFGDKRAIYERALQHYLERNLADRIRSFEAFSPRDAIAAFFEGIVKRSLGDRERKGCMLVNAALEVAPHDPGLRKIVIEVFAEIEAFFLVHVRAGQANGTITRCLPATTLARHLLGVLMGIRVLARVRPEQDLLESVVAASLALLGNGESRRRSR